MVEMKYSIEGEDAPDISLLTKKMYIFAYDVPAETKKSIQDDTELVRWLMKQRDKIQTYMVKGLEKQKGVGVKTGQLPPGLMLQKSLYRINEGYVDDVISLSDQWEREYNDRGFEVRMEVFPIATTEHGFRAFFDMQFDNTMGRIGDQDEQIMKALDQGKIPGKTKNEVESNLYTLTNVINMYFGRGTVAGGINPDYNEEAFNSLTEYMDMVQSSFRRMSATCEVVKSWQSPLGSGDMP
jgi:hypothetical protein